MRNCTCTNTTSHTVHAKTCFGLLGFTMSSSSSSSYTASDNKQQAAHQYTHTTDRGKFVDVSWMLARERDVLITFTLQKIDTNTLLRVGFFLF